MSVDPKALSRPETSSENPQKEKDIITSRLKTRSVSLSQCDSKKPDSPPKRNISAKRKSPPSPVSVQERMSHFEQVQNKYLRQRCQKALNREKMKQEKPKPKKKSKNSSEDEKSIASMLKAIHADIRTMKSDLQDNTSKVNA